MIDERTHRARDTGTPPASTIGRVAELAGAVGLVVVAWIHVIDLPGKMSEVPYLGFAYLVLIAGSVLAAVLLLRRERRGWLLGGSLAIGAAVAFVLSRTTGLPAAGDDVGNWAETLGTWSLLAEGFVAFLAVTSVVARRSVQHPAVRS